MPRSSGFFFFVSLALVAALTFGGVPPTASAQSGPALPLTTLRAVRATSPESTTDLSGQMIAAPGGRPFRNVEVTLLNISSGATLRTHTDVRGRYKFNGIVTGIDYVLTPWKPGYVFSPGAMVITPSAVTSEYNFTGEVEPGFWVAPQAP